MGWLDRKVKEHEEVYWKNLEKAKPIIKQRADQILTQLGYDPAPLAAVIFPKGQGVDEIWTVKYWFVDPNDYTATVIRHGDFEVYLNNQGKIRRVVKYEQGHEQLLYGKDQRIDNGMTPEQVRERLGEPDYKGSPPRYIRRDRTDEMWKYKKTPDRTVMIEVFFKDGKVSSISSFGE